MNCPNYRDCDFTKKVSYDAKEAVWYRNYCLNGGPTWSNIFNSKLEKPKNNSLHIGKGSIKLNKLERVEK